MSDFLALSVAERILLVEDIWDSIAGVPDAVKLTEAQRQELDSRLDAYTRRVVKLRFVRVGWRWWNQ